MREAASTDAEMGHRGSRVSLRRACAHGADHHARVAPVVQSVVEVEGCSTGFRASCPVLARDLRSSPRSEARRGTLHNADRKPRRRRRRPGRPGPLAGGRAGGLAIRADEPTWWAPWGSNTTTRGVQGVVSREITGVSRVLRFRGSTCRSITGDSGRCRRMFGIGSEGQISSLVGVTDDAYRVLGLSVASPLCQRSRVLC